MTVSSDGWVEPNLTKAEALAQGLFVAELSMGSDAPFIGLGRTRDDAVANARHKAFGATLICVTAPHSPPRVTGGPS